jgi:threonine dehydratase
MRGALNAALAGAPVTPTVAAASAGNHASALAAAARIAGRGAVLFVPRGAPRAKIDRIREAGGEVRLVEGDYDDAEAAAASWAEGRADVDLVHAFDDARVVEGQATLGLEVMEQHGGVRTVIAPVGGGGLLAGLLAACAPRGVTVLGAQGDRTRAVHDALGTGIAGPTTVVPTIMDGLAGRTTQTAVDRLREAAARVELVPEAEAAEAVRVLHALGERVEGSGAVALAALLAGVYDPAGPVAIIVSGGNIDDALLAEVLAGAI